MRPTTNKYDFYIAIVYGAMFLVVALSLADNPFDGSELKVGGAGTAAGFVLHKFIKRFEI